MKSIRKGLIYLLIFIAAQSSAQPIACEPNLDWELNNFSHWEFFQNAFGTITPRNTPFRVFPPTGGLGATATVGRMTITRYLSPSDTDYYGGFPISDPSGGDYSFKLGDTDQNYRGDRARYKVHVPKDAKDFAIIYRFAVVLQDPGHSPFAQPAFFISTVDSATGDTLPCGQHLYVAGSLPGFKTSKVDTAFHYKPWASGFINLSAYSGKTILLDFSRANCAAGAHNSYAYIDVSCSSNTIKTNYSYCDSITSLSAPPGFQTYSWIDSASSAVLDTGQTIKIPTPAKTITIKLILTPYKGYGCMDTLTKVLYVSALNIHVKDTALCAGKPLTLNPTILYDIAPTIYNWSPGTGLSCTNCKNPSLTTSSSIKYILTVTDSTACSRKDTFAIEVYALPKIKATDTFICLGDSVQLSVSGASSYKWTPATGLSCDTCSSPMSGSRSNTIYTVIGKDINGCLAQIPVTVTVNKPRKIMVQAPDPICKGDQAQLIVTGSAFYQWSPAASLSCSDCDTTNARPTETTTYTVTGTDSNSCKDSLQVILQVKPLPEIILTKDTLVCSGKPVKLFASGAEYYSWTPTNGLSCSNCSSPLVTVQNNTVYTVKGVGFNGCINFKEINVSIINDTIPDAEFIINPTVAYIDSPFFLFENQSIYSVRYQWYYNQQLISEDEDVKEKFPDIGKYCVTLVATGVCGQTDTATQCCEVKEKGRLAIPNAFTPNGDSKNDYFRVLLTGAYSKFEMSIFNRYGEKIFSANKPENGWNGDFNNKPEEMGVYFYLIKILFNYPGAKEESYKGDVTLIR